MANGQDKKRQEQERRQSRFRDRLRNSSFRLRLRDREDELDTSLSDREAPPPQPAQSEEPPQPERQPASQFRNRLTGEQEVAGSIPTQEDEARGFERLGGATRAVGEFATSPERWKEAGKGFVHGVGGTAAGTLKGIAALGASQPSPVSDFLESRKRRPEDLILGRPQRKPVEQTPYWLAGEWIEEGLQKHLPRDPEIMQEFIAGKVPEALGSFATYIGAGGGASAVAGRMAQNATRQAAMRQAQLTASTALAGTGGAGLQYQDAIASGADAPTAARAAQYGVGPGLLQVFPVMQAINRASPKAFGTLQKLMTSRLKEGAKGAVEEAVTESLGTMGHNQVARMLYAEDRSLGQGVMDAGTVGGAAGFITSFVLAMAGAKMGRMPGTDVGFAIGETDNFPPGYDPYGVLGVSPFASDEEIKKVFRERAMTVHPDVSVDPDAHQAFLNLNDAYQAIQYARGKAGATPPQPEAAKPAEARPARPARPAEEPVGDRPGPEVKVDMEGVAQEPEVVDKPLKDRGKRTTRTETEREREVVGAEDGSTVRMRQTLFEEEYEDGTKVLRNRAGEIIEETVPPEQVQTEAPAPETEGAPGETEPVVAETIPEPEAPVETVPKSPPKAVEPTPTEAEQQDPATRAKALMERLSAIPKANRPGDLTGAPGQRATSSVAKGRTGGFSTDYMNQEMDKFEAVLSQAETTVPPTPTEEIPDARVPQQEEADEAVQTEAEVQEEADEAKAEAEDVVPQDTKATEPDQETEPVAPEEVAPEEAPPVGEPVKKAEVGDLETKINETYARFRDRGVREGADLNEDGVTKVAGDALDAIDKGNVSEAREYLRILEQSVVPEPTFDIEVQSDLPVRGGKDQGAGNIGQERMTVPAGTKVRRVERPERFSDRYKHREEGRAMYQTEDGTYFATSEQAVAETAEAAETAAAETAEAAETPAVEPDIAAQANVIEARLDEFGPADGNEADTEALRQSIAEIREAIERGDTERAETGIEFVGNAIASEPARAGGYGRLTRVRPGAMGKEGESVRIEVIDGGRAFVNPLGVTMGFWVPVEDIEATTEAPTWGKRLKRNDRELVPLNVAGVGDGNLQRRTGETEWTPTKVLASVLARHLERSLPQEAGGVLRRQLKWTDLGTAQADVLAMIAGNPQETSLYQEMTDEQLARDGTRDAERPGPGDVREAAEGEEADTAPRAEGERGERDVQEAREDLGEEPPGVVRPEAGERAGDEGRARPDDVRLPPDLRRAKPRYGYRGGNYQIAFPDDVTLAVYIATKPWKSPSPRREEYRQFVREQEGYNKDSDVISEGNRIRDELKSQAKALFDIGEAKGTLTAQSAVVPAAPVGDTGEMPTRVLRIEDKESPYPSGNPTDKPQGLFTSPADRTSPHEDLGGERRTFDVNPQANILTLEQYPPEVAVMRYGATGAGAGVHMARHFSGEDRFNKLKGMSLSELRAEGARLDSSFDWDDHGTDGGDRQDLVEAIGGVLARQAGYDAVWVPNPRDHEGSEFVALTEKAFAKPEAVPEPEVREPVRHEGAAPRKLSGTGRAAAWGAAVPNTDVQVGDMVQVTTRNGKQWDAKVTEIVIRTDKETVVKTERTDGSAVKGKRVTFSKKMDAERGMRHGQMSVVRVGGEVVGHITGSHGSHWSNKWWPHDDLAEHLKLEEVRRDTGRYMSTETAFYQSTIPGDNWTWTTTGNVTKAKAMARSRFARLQELEEKGIPAEPEAAPEPEPAAAPEPEAEPDPEAPSTIGIVSFGPVKRQFADSDPTITVTLKEANVGEIIKMGTQEEPKWVTDSGLRGFTGLPNLGAAEKNDLAALKRHVAEEIEREWSKPPPEPEQQPEPDRTPSWGMMQPEGDAIALHAGADGLLGQLTLQDGKWAPDRRLVLTMHSILTQEAGIPSSRVTEIVDTMRFDDVEEAQRAVWAIVVQREFPVEQPTEFLLPPRLARPVAGLRYKGVTYLPRFYRDIDRAMFGAFFTGQDTTNFHEWLEEIGFTPDQITQWAEQVHQSVVTHAASRFRVNDPSNILRIEEITPDPTPREPEPVIDDEGEVVEEDEESGYLSPTIKDARARISFSKVRFLGTAEGRDREFDILVDGKVVGMATYPADGNIYFTNALDFREIGGPVEVGFDVDWSHEASKAKREIKTALAQELVTPIEMHEEPTPPPPVDPARPDPPEPDVPIFTETVEVGKKTLEQRMEQYAPAFLHLDAEGVDAEGLHEPAHEWLRAAELVGMATDAGNVLDQVADAVREEDPDLLQEDIAEDLFMLMWDPDEAVAWLRDQTAEMQAMTLTVREEGPTYGPKREPTPEEKARERMRRKSSRRRGKGMSDNMPPHIRERMRQKKAEEELGSKPDEEDIKPTDFPITPDDLSDLGGPKQRARQNLEALALVKELDGRPATVSQQKTLIKWVGWGGLADAFGKMQLKPRWRGDKKPPLVRVWKDARWKEIGEALQATLTEEEYDTAEDSTQYAHYTSPEVVLAMYGALERMGVSGRVQALEPGAGIGHFIGMSPFRGRFVAIEKDKITGAILEALYPSAQTTIKPYEQVEVRDEAFDVVIGNPPFSSHTIKYDGANHSLHDYFIVRSLDKLRPGGILAFVTSTYTMDKGQGFSREAMAKRADFLGAVRLPRTAFKKVAGTEVTTDILFFQKRHPHREPAHADEWQSVAYVTADLKEVEETGKEHLKRALRAMSKGEGPDIFKINEYYVRNPGMLLGKIVRATTVPRPKRGELPSPLAPAIDIGEGNLAEMIDERLQALPEGIYTEAFRTTDEDPLAGSEVEGLFPGQYTIRNGKIVMRSGQQLVPVKLPTDKALKTAATKLGLPVETRRRVITRIKMLVELGLADRKIRDVTRDWKDDETLEAAQAELTSLYDRFVKRYGPISKEVYSKDGSKLIQPALLHYSDQVHGPFVQRLDRYDKDTDSYVKAPIFTERMYGTMPEVNQVDEPWQALVISLQKTAGIDMKIITRLTGMTEEQAVAALEGRIFRDPDGGKLVTRHEYLSGNVREKLALAELAATRSDRFKANVEALKEVQPQNLTSSDIKHLQGSTIGALWIPVDAYVKFLKAEIGLGNPKVERRDADGAWSVTRGPIKSRVLYDNYGVPPRTEDGIVKDGLSAKEIFVQILNRWKTEVTYWDVDGEKNLYDAEGTMIANEKRQLIQRRFDEWMWDRRESRRQEYVNLWNRKMNNSVLADWKGEGELLRDHVTEMAANFRGKPFNPRGWQLDAAWRYLMTGNMLIGHDTGSGKTITMVLIAMLAKQMGLARKPMMVTTRPTLKQSRDEMQDLFPSAMTLMADENNYKDAAARNQFLADVVANDWDAVIMDMYAFQHVQASPDFEAKIFRRIVREYRTLLASAMAGSGTPSDFQIKKLRKAILKYEQKIRQILSRQRSRDALYFEDLGVDLVIVDEAHNYKNLSLPSLTRTDFKGSGQAVELYVKTRYLEDVRNPGRGIVFATATPVANAIREQYTMLRFLAEQDLRDRGYGNEDLWASDFISAWAALEVNKTARLEMRHRERTFINAFVGASLFRSHADMLFPDEVDLPVPPIVDGEGNILDMAEIVEVGDPETGETDPRLAKMMRSLNHRMDNLKPHYEREKGFDDSLLNIIDDGKKLALAAELATSRFVRAYGHDPSIPWNRTKTEMAAENIAAELERYERDRGTVLVFADQGVSGAKAGTARKPPSGPGLVISEAISWGDYTLYDDLKNRLVLDYGVPESEIYFMRDAKTTAERQAIVDRFNAGDIRVLIGATKNMGEGLNLNRRLVSIEHLDTTWRPDQVKQRDGRGLRIGNLLYETGVIAGLRIRRYVTKGSLDAWRWEVVGYKKRAIEMMTRADPSTGAVEADIADVDQGQEASALKAAALDNPYAQPLEETRAQVIRLETLERDHKRQQERYQDSLAKNRRRMTGQTEIKNWILERAQKIRNMVKFHEEPDSFTEQHLTAYMGWTYREVRRWEKKGKVPDHMAVIIGKERFETLKDIEGSALGEAVSKATERVIFGKRGDDIVKGGRTRKIGTIAGLPIYAIVTRADLGHGDVIRFSSRLEVDSKKFSRISTSHISRRGDEGPPQRGLHSLQGAAERALKRAEQRAERIQDEINDAQRYVGKDFPHTAQLGRARAKVGELARKYTEHIQRTQEDIDPFEFAEVDLDNFERESDNIYDDYHAPGGPADSGRRGRDPKEMEAYETLGLKPEMTKDEYKAAFRKLARKHHPDLGGDPKAFRKMYEAYEYLKGLGVTRETGPEYRQGVQVLADKPRQGVEPGVHLSPAQQEHAELTFGSVNKQLDVASGVVQRAGDMAEVSGPYVRGTRRPEALDIAKATVEEVDRIAPAIKLTEDDRFEILKRLKKDERKRKREARKQERSDKWLVRQFERLEADLFLQAEHEVRRQPGFGEDTPFFKAVRTYLLANLKTDSEYHVFMGSIRMALYGEAYRTNVEEMIGHRPTAQHDDPWHLLDDLIEYKSGWADKNRIKEARAEVARLALEHEAITPSDYVVGDLPAHAMTAKRLAATVDALEKLPSDPKSKAQVVREALRIDMAELETQPLGLDDTFYRADLTNPETRQALVEGTAKPLHAWVKPIGTPIRTPEDLFRMAREHGRSKTQENLQFVLLKDGKVSDVLVATSGAIDYTSISNTAFFSVRAYIHQTQPDEVVMVHNHPTHRARPSTEDLGVLKNFRNAMTAEGMADITVNGMVIDSNTFTWWGEDTGGELQSFRLPTLPGDPKYVGVASQRHPTMTPRDIVIDIAREASQGNRMVFLGIDVAFQHVVTLRQPVSGEPITREWLHTQARKYGVKFWTLGIPDIATYHTVLTQLENDGLITQSLLQDPGYVVDVVYSGEEEGVTAPLELLGTKGPTGEAEQRMSEWVHFAKVAPISTEGKLFAVLREDPVTEYGDIRKPREKRKKRTDRLNIAASLRAAFQEYTKDQKVLTDDLREQAIEILRIVGIPKPAEKLLRKLENATTVAQMRSAFAAIGRFQTFQLKRNAKEDLRDALTRAKIPEMGDEYLEEAREAVKGLNLKTVADHKTRSILGSGTKQLRSVSAEHVREVAERIEAISEQERADRKKKRKAFRKRVDDAAKQIIREIGSKKTLLKGAKPTLGVIGRARSGVRKRKGQPRRSLLSLYVGEASIRPSVIMEWLSPMLHKLAYDDISIVAHKKEDELRYQFTDPVRLAVEVASGRRWKTRELEQWRTEVFEVEGAEITRDEAMQILLSMKDPTNLEIMLAQGITINSNGQSLDIDFDVVKGEDGEQTIESPTINELRDIVGDEGQQIIETIFRILNGTMKDELNSEWQKAYYKPVARVPNYVYRQMDMRTIEQEGDPMEEISEGRDPTVTSWGHLRSRTRKPRGRIRVGGMLTGFFSHAAHVARIASYVYPAHFVHSVFRKTSVRRAIESRVGPQGYSRIVDSIKMQTVRYYDRSMGQRLVRRLTGSISVAKLGMRPSTWFLNLAGLYTTATYEIADGNPGFKWLHKAMRMSLSRKVRRRVRAEALAASGQWRRRYEEDFANEAFAGLADQGEMHFGPPSLGEYGLYILKLTDRWGGIVRWLMAEQKLDKQGVKKEPDPLAEEWMRLLFSGESSSHGGDMTGAIAEGKRNAYFAPFVMFLSAASKLASLNWKVMMSPNTKMKAQALGGIGAVAMLITAIRVLMDLPDEEELPGAGEIVRRTATEMVSPYPIIGNNLVPLISRIFGEAGPTFPASAAEEFLEDITALSRDVVDVSLDAFAGELNAEGEYRTGEQAIRLADDAASVIASLVGGGFPYEGTRDMIGWVLPDGDNPLSTEAADVQQPVRRMRRSLRRGDNSLFRESVRDWEEAKGSDMSSREPLTMVNRWLGDLTRYEPGKPARETLSPSQLQEVDDMLREREELRQAAVDMTEMNSDLFGPGTGGRQKRQKRPTRAKRQKREKR